MHRHTMFGVMMLSVSLALSAIQPGGAEPMPETMHALIQGNNAFAVEVYAQLQTQPGNIFFCPYSLRTALLMTYAGARGNTAMQMATVLHVTDAAPTMPADVQRWQTELTAGPHTGYQLLTANALWGQQGYAFRPEFLELNRTYYRAGLYEVDFTNALEKARNTINAWVAEQTRNKIRDFLKPQMLDASTVLALTNAIYVKGQWALPFDPQKTVDMPFMLTKDEQVTVPMMNQLATFNYAETEAMQVLELPYVGNRLALVYLLPRVVNGLATLEAQLSPAYIDTQIVQLRPQKVSVTLPKFRLVMGMALPKVLHALGIVDAFVRGTADFSGMTTQAQLYISQVIHQTFLEINEEGAEAGAASAVTMSRGMARNPAFVADHPFLLLIRDTQTGGILFLGRVMNPQS
jgi:serine protease inhibitor